MTARVIHFGAGLPLQTEGGEPALESNEDEAQIRDEGNAGVMFFKLVLT